MCIFFWEVKEVKEVSEDFVGELIEDTQDTQWGTGAEMRRE